MNSFELLVNTKNMYVLMNSVQHASVSPPPIVWSNQASHEQKLVTLLVHTNGLHVYE